MGACTFTQFEQRQGDDDTPTKAFRRAREQAQWEHGHGGYSGTLAEKHEIVLVAGDGGTLGNQQAVNPPAVDCATAETTAYRLMERSDPRIDDKWGPAGCIRVKGGSRRVFIGGLKGAPGVGSQEQEYDGWLFFGWASS